MDDLNKTLQNIIIDDSQFAREKINVLYENLYTNLIGAGLPAILIFTIVWLHEPNPIYLAWLIIVFLVILLRIVLHYFYTRASINKESIPRWKARFDIGVLTSGAAWGLAGSVAPNMPVTIQILILVSFAGFISGSVITYRASLRSFFCLSIPIMLPTAAVYFLNTDSDGRGIGLVLLIYVLMMAIFALKLNKRFIEALNLKVQNDFLIKSLNVKHIESQEEIALSKRLTLAIESSTDAIYITEPDGTITYSNPAFTIMTGWDSEVVLGENPRVLKSGKMPDVFYQKLWSTLKRGSEWHGIIINRRKIESQSEISNDDTWNDKTLFWAQSTIAPIKDDANYILGYIAVQRDISSEVKREKREAYQRESAIIRADVSGILQKQIPLTERVENVLEALVQFEGLHVQQKAGVFLLPVNGYQLEMYAMHGEFTDEFISKEKCVKLGSCLCGRVALSGDILISDDCFKDKFHEHKFENMAAHGHYIVPLKNVGKVLGVMFLYTDPNPSRDKSRLIVLEQIGEMIGLAIANEIARDEIEHARQIAENASREKAEFLANMSHEIRTPMNGVLGMLELLSDKRLDKESTQYISSAQGAAEILMNVINDILDLSKIESGKMTIEDHIFDLGKIPGETIDLFQEQASRKGLIINRSIAEDIPQFVKGDYLRLQQILSNLISNAIKFTEQGSVDVNIRKISERKDSVSIHFEVIDSGIGVAKENQSKIFEPFSQADGSTSRRFGGTGLGLSISGHLLKLMGGTSISLKSKPGIGSTFGFELPFKRVDSDELKESKELTENQIFSLAEDLKAVQPNILLAEDNPMNQMVAEKLLTNIGCKVVIKDNGKQVLEAIKKDQYELILMDCQMPEMDGYTATKMIRDYEKENEIEPIPIIAITANAMDGDREQCLAAGMDDYMSKPFTKIQLQKILVSWLNFETQET